MLIISNHFPITCFPVWREFVRRQITVIASACCGMLEEQVAP